MRAIEHYLPMGAVFRAPRSDDAYSEPGFKTMRQWLTKNAQHKAIVEHFTFRNLHGHYAACCKLKYCGLPELHTDPKTTAAAHEGVAKYKEPHFKYPPDPIILN